MSSRQSLHSRRVRDERKNGKRWVRMNSTHGNVSFSYTVRRSGHTDTYTRTGSHEAVVDMLLNDCFAESYAILKANDWAA